MSIFKKKNEVVETPVTSRPTRETYSLDKIPQDKFSFAHKDESLHDTKFETKPVSFLKDAMRRFAKNKASVVAAALIAIIALFAIFEPIFDPKNKDTSAIGFEDSFYGDVLPSLGNGVRGSGFWDGSKKVQIQQIEYDLKSKTDANYPIITKTIKTEHIVKDSKFEQLRKDYYLYTVRQDSYAVVGCKTISSQTQEQIDAIRAYEVKHSVQIMKPLLDIDGYVSTFATENGLSEGDSIVQQLKMSYTNKTYSYVYYKMQPQVRNKTNEFIAGTVDVKRDSEGKPVYEDIYLRDSSGNLVYQRDAGNGTFDIRVDYYDYFTYKRGFQPAFPFGASDEGKDICLRLAKGIRFSLLLGVGVSLINFLIGLVYGAISGYYGGVADLIMERITDIISTVPTIIIMTICSIQFTNNVELKAALGPAGVLVLSFLVAFVYNGWIGVAGTTRMQFYRFKGQEYVLASRTLGARDGRLIFRHILPNAAGTLVTSTVLMIPGVIFSESSLSFLGIVDFSLSGLSSVGSLLEEGQKFLSTYPHMVMFPAVVISLLMISFNLFGNGLRDAFNTSLRGSEE